jgi:predicted phosphohydrolase
VRATWLTDLHLNFLDEERLRAFLATVTRTEPEIIFVTGDTGEASSVARFIVELDAIAPAYVVLGNHDFYGSSIDDVRVHASARMRWLPALAPVRLTASTQLVGVDGWGDARCGDLESRVMLSDWHAIRDLRGLTAPHRIAALQTLGAREAEALRTQLERFEPARELIVLTHVPPFAGACWHDGKQSAPDWLPWFTCIAVGEVLHEYAQRHPRTAITVLCGHSHGRGEYRAAENLVVRTGGWAPGQPDYGNPIVQASWSIP